MPNNLGKRYTCAECEATVLVTKAGDGAIECHGKAMEVLQAKPLPSVTERRRRSTRAYPRTR